MASATKARNARQLQVIAISPDESSVSQIFAAEYGIDFPLLEDADHRWAKKYVGMTEDGFPLPGLYLLRPDGSVFFKQLATAKNDRVYAARLLQLVDKMNGVTAKDGLPGAAEYERGNTFRVGLGLGGERADDNTDFALDVELTYLRRLGRYVGLGLQLTTLTLPRRELGVLVVPRLQLPYLSGVGEVYLEFPIGYARRWGQDGENGGRAGVSIGSEFEVSPTLIAFGNLDLGGARYTPESAAGGSLLISRFVLRLGAGWKF